MSEFVDLETIARTAPYRQLPHHQVADWQAACDRAGDRRMANGLLRFCPRSAAPAPAGALFGLPRRRPLLPFVRSATMGALASRVPPDDTAA